MKKALSAALILCMALSLFACSRIGKADGSDTTARSDAVTTEKESVHIEPMQRASLDTENLADGTYAVSFSSADVIDNEGLLELHFVIYDYDRYDASQISQLDAGAVLTADGKDITVETVVKTDTGIAVNGGAKDGGTDLLLGDDGTYYIADADGKKDYKAAGDATLPVYQDFILTDDSDPSDPDKYLLAGDLFSLKDDSIGYKPDNTILAVDKGYIVYAHRVSAQ